MEFQDVVRHRRMVRNFAPDRPIPPELVERIIDNARRAPSAGNTQGWAFLVLQQTEDRDRFWDAMLPLEKRDGFAYPGLLSAPLIVVPLACKNDYIDRYAEPDKRWTDRDEARWPTPFWLVDTAFSTMLMLLTAVDNDLGALFFGVFNVPRFRDTFGVPDAYHPLGAVAIGYPLPDRRSPSLARGRRPVDAVVHLGRFTNPRAAAPLPEPGPS